VKAALESGNLAVVTGGASGIGLGMARRFVAEGLRVVVADVNIAALDSVSSSLGPDVVVRRLDVRDPAQFEELAAVASALGPVRVFCNNAGIIGSKGDPMWATPLDDWQRVFAVNVFGIVNGVNAFVPKMLEHGLPSHIVHTSSLTGVTLSSYVPSYVASKHAIVALTDTLRAQLASRGAHIDVTALCPGGVVTDLVANSRTLEERSADDEPLPSHHPDRLHPDAVAENVLQAITAGRDFAFPSPESRERVESWVESIVRWL